MAGKGLRRRGGGNAGKTTRKKLATSQRKIKFSQRRRRPKTCENCKYRLDSQVEGGNYVVKVGRQEREGGRIPIT